MFLMKNGILFLYNTDGEAYFLYLLLEITDWWDIRVCRKCIGIFFSRIFVFIPPEIVQIQKNKCIFKKKKLYLEFKLHEDCGSPKYIYFQYALIFCKCKGTLAKDRKKKALRTMTDWTSNVLIHCSSDLKLQKVIYFR